MAMLNVAVVPSPGLAAFPILLLARREGSHASICELQGTQASKRLLKTH